jgi:hypothetical protein
MYRRSALTSISEGQLLFVGCVFQILHTPIQRLNPAVMSTEVMLKSKRIIKILLEISCTEFFDGFFNPFISVNPSKPLRSWLTLHNYIYYISEVNFDLGDYKDLFFIGVSIYSGPGVAGLQLIS